MLAYFPLSVLNVGLFTCLELPLLLDEKQDLKFGHVVLVLFEFVSSITSCILSDK